MDREESVQHFLDLIKKSRRGKFKVYIGMIAGVGKSYRMLQEAHDLIDNGVDVRIGSPVERITCYPAQETVL